MREVFRHDAVVLLGPGGDSRAPGAAITVALCGAWEHDPPCLLAPHRTDAEQAGDQVHLRVLFTCDPNAQTEVRDLVEQALARGALTGPDGRTTTWRLCRSHPADLEPSDAGAAQALLRN